MKVQTLETPLGERYILLDDNYKPVDEVKRFLKYCDASGKSPNSLRSYAMDLKLFYEYMALKGIPVKDLCSNAEKGPVEILSEFIIWLQYPKAGIGIYKMGGEDPVRKNVTVNHIVDTVLSFYQFLSANNEIQELEVYKNQRMNERFKSFLFELVHNRKEIMKSIFKKPVMEEPVKYITREQFNTLFALCSTRRDKLLLAILFEAGLRINEALGLHISDISNIEDRALDIVPRENNENKARVKRYAGGRVYLAPYVIDLLLEYINEDVVYYDSDFLFLTLRGKNKGQPMGYKAASKLFERLSAKAGFDVTPHMLRHGFATEKLANGWEMVDIQAYLRHKNIQSTQIYASYTDNLKKEKMREFLEAGIVQEPDKDE